MKFQVPTFEIKGNLDTIYFIFGNPWWLSVKNLPANVGDSSSIPGSGRSPGEEWQPTPVFLPGKFHGQRRLVGYNP